MKINQIYNFYKTSESIFQCPICHTKMKVQEPASIVCANQHCYNLSKDGYINFLPNAKASKYQKELFECRRKVFEHGYYLPLAEEICRIADSTRKETDLCLVDAGCGEGYYDCFLHENLKNKEIYAFDSVKEAIRMGAKKNKEIRWFVGNLAELPLGSKQADLLLEIFAPANYSEFRRIAKKEGYILKVIPGDQYLKELRARIRLNAKSESYSSSAVEEYFSRNMKLEQRKYLRYEKELDAEMAVQFLKMSPLMFGKSKDDIELSELGILTFDFVLLLGRFYDEQQESRDFKVK